MRWNINVLDYINIITIYMLNYHAPIICFPNSNELYNLIGYDYKNLHAKLSDYIM
jgi:hypothetical protein